MVRSNGPHSLLITTAPVVSTSRMWRSSPLAVTWPLSSRSYGGWSVHPTVSRRMSCVMRRPRASQMPARRGANHALGATRTMLTAQTMTAVSVQRAQRFGVRDDDLAALGLNQALALELR